MKARLYVSVDMKKDDDLVELTEQIIAVVGYEPDGSGAGFGARDVEFSIHSMDEATKAENRLLQWASDSAHAAQASVVPEPTIDDVSDAIATVLNDYGSGLGFDTLLHQQLVAAVMEVVKSKLEE